MRALRRVGWSICKRTPDFCCWKSNCTDHGVIKIPFTPLQIPAVLSLDHHYNANSYARNRSVVYD